MSPHDARRVDDLRERLRALGYLDARVDRFVLGRSAGRARPAALALGASARIGALAGALLGPAAVIGLRARLPGLVTGAADALVLAVYLAMAFAVATAAVAAAGILAGGLLARRAGARPGVARRARRAAALTGVAVTVACLAYLVLWWRAAAGEPTGLPVGLTAGMLVVAVATSLFLGHAVTVVMLAWLARSGIGQALAPGLPLSSRTAVATLGLLALAGGVALLVITGPRAPDSPPALVVVPTGERVLVLAIDGVDPGTVRRLAAEGRLPALGPLLTGSAVALASTTGSRDPARVWTTLATGQPAERHGITGLESRRVAGVEGRFRPDSPWWTSLVTATDLIRLTRPAVTSGGERQAPTFWEVAARAGLRTAVVHWWATWPAPDDLGVVLTDRAILRLEQGGALDGEIAPAALYADLQAGWPDRRARAATRAAGAVPDDEPMSSDVAAAIRRSAELDATLIDLAADPALGTPDLLVLYLPGLDIAQHALLGAGAGASLSPSAAAARLASLERYYEFLDRALTTLLPRGGDAAGATLVLAITQPGRVSGPADGLLAAAGAAANQAGGLAEPTAVAPTVLYALGVPVASDLASAPHLPLFDAAFTAAHEVRGVETYGPVNPPPRTRTGRPLDREMIERMRSLGYLR